MQIAYIVSCNSAGGVAGDELELHFEFSEEEQVFGLKPWAGKLVKGKAEKLATVEYLAAVVPPGDLHIFVEVAGGDGDAGGHERTPC